MVAFLFLLLACSTEPQDTSYEAPDTDTSSLRGDFEGTCPDAGSLALTMAGIPVVVESYPNGKTLPADWYAWGSEMTISCSPTSTVRVVWLP